MTDPDAGPALAGRICVFCGSHVGADTVYADAARALGYELARRRLGLVFGGGGVGLMGAVADAVLDAGGEVTGVIPAALVAREVGHPQVDDLRIVHSMHERKALMSELSDAFVALPGGLGTLEEIFEVLTWLQLGIHGKPCGLLDVADYWQPLLLVLDRAVDQGFVKPANRELLMHATDPADLLNKFASYRSPVRERWLDESER